MLDKLTLNQVELSAWNRIQSHSFDTEGNLLSFSARLARENCWSETFALAVIEEYRRFCLLAVVCEHPVTPSNEVDQVWHLHLTYSQDYWNEFCPNVLKADFHHGPTQGGTTESDKFRDWYQTTLDSYKDVFGEPPKEIWPSVPVRFANAGDMIHVNKSDVYVLSKKTVKVLVSSLLFSISSLLAVTASAAEPSEASSLIYFIPLGLLVISIILVIGLSFNSRNKNDSSGGTSGAYGGGNDSSDGTGDGGSGCGGGCGGCGG